MRGTLKSPYMQILFRKLGQFCSPPLGEIIHFTIHRVWKILTVIFKGFSALDIIDNLQGRIKLKPVKSIALHLFFPDCPWKHQDGVSQVLISKLILLRLMVQEDSAVTQPNPIDADNTSQTFYSTLANSKLQGLDIAAPLLVIPKGPLLPAVIFCSFLEAPTQFIPASISEGLSAVSNQVWFQIVASFSGSQTK